MQQRNWLSSNYASTADNWYHFGKSRTRFTWDNYYIRKISQPNILFICSLFHHKMGTRWQMDIRSNRPISANDPFGGVAFRR